jgi:Tol biopolymer transport system component
LVPEPVCKYWLGFRNSKKTRGEICFQNSFKNFRFYKENHKIKEYENMKKLFVILVCLFMIATVFSVSFAVSAGKGGGGKPPKDDPPTPANPAISYYSYGDGGHKNGLWVMDADGSHQTLINEGKALFRTWSPDGLTVAFENGGLWLMDFNVIDGIPLGSNARKIASDTTFGDYRKPAWSPIDDVIAYVSASLYYDENNDYHQKHHIKLIDPVPVNNEYQSTEIYSTTDELISSPTWSPDGTELAYIKHSYPPLIGGQFISIEILTISNREVTAITELSAEDLGVTDVIGLEWSSTQNDVLAYSTGPEIYTLDLDTLTSEYLCDGINPSWSPDDSLLAFVEIVPGKGNKGDTYNIKTLDLTTSEVTHFAKGLCPDWMVS